MEKEIVSQKSVESFLNGEDPEEFIVGIEYDYRTNSIYKIIQDPVRGKVVRKDTFIPFLWAGDLTGLNFYKGSKATQKKKMGEHGILIERLNTYENDRLENGLKYLIKSLHGYTSLLNFFKQGGINPWDEKYKKYFIILSPAEQYLIQKKKRLFKGINEYTDIHRFVFDIETTGLNPETDNIILIGVKDSNGFRRVIDALGDDGEKRCIKEFFKSIKESDPSIIGGHNSASFDFPFILKRAEILGVDIQDISDIYGMSGIKVKDGMLKLASEIEPYDQYLLWGFNVIDTSHAVRRAQAINSEIKSWGLKYITKYLEKEKPNRVYIDGAHISKIYNENKEYYINPKSGKYKEIGEPGTENLLQRFPGKYDIWNGKKIVEQYLDDDLYETMVVDESFSQATFLISKLVPTTYERVSTMGTATLWKLIMLAWSYERNLAIPEKEEKRAFTGGLSRLLSVGYSKNIVKFDFRSLYPSINLTFDVFPECDVTNAQKSILKYFLDVRLKYKNLSKDYEKTNPQLSEMYDRKQLPIKIFINAYFGSLSAPLIFPWGDIDKGETDTCFGRQFLRMMMMFFKKRGYNPLLMDTDGVNFSIPDDVNDRKYIGKGLCILVEKDKEYSGTDADVAEFNDIFMRDEMGLDIDYRATSCVNVSRKNYIIKKIVKGKEKIKLTGATIKSKNIPQYISDFLDDGLIHLLNGDGLSFIELYYSYVENIYNKKIPLAKIANKSRVKQSVEEYKKYIKKTTKAGSLMARQAHMELLLENNYQASLGETIYYVNNGSSKSHGDVQRVTGYDKKYSKKELSEYVATHGKQPPKVTKVNINCYMIPEKDIMNNPDMTGDYNVSRYLTTFNKRIEPLLVVFHPEIRDSIIIDDPEKRSFFTKHQSELCGGFPLKEDGQDDYNNVMTLSDSEVIFWNKIGKDPFFMYTEDNIKEIDQYWVDFNRKVVNFQEKSTENNEDEEIIETDGNDYAVVLE